MNRVRGPVGRNWTAVAFGIGLVAAGCGGSAPSEPPMPPPPIPSGVAAAGGTELIPPDLLRLPPDPPADPEVRRLAHEGRSLPAQINPCGGPPPGRVGVVENRQIIVIADGRLWKSERIVRYRNRADALAAAGEIRAALARCREHTNVDGSVTHWQTAELAIGDEAYFVGGQMYRDGRVLRGHFRGIVMRSGPALFVAFDFNRNRKPPAVPETEEQQQHAAELAPRLSQLG